MSKIRTHYTETPKVAIISVPHSATRYTVMLLQSNRIKVKHEEVGREGIVDWMYPFRCYRAEAPLILHQLRHPLDVINSLATGSNTDWEKMFSVLPIDKSKDKLTRSVEVWIYWSAICDRISSMSYKREDRDGLQR